MIPNVKVNVFTRYKFRGFFSPPSGKARKFCFLREKEDGKEMPCLTAQRHCHTYSSDGEKDGGCVQ